MLLTIFFGPRYHGRLRGCVSMHTHCLVNRIINKHCDIIQQSKGNQMRILEPKNCIQRMPTHNSPTHLILIHRQVAVSLCELGLLNKSCRFAANVLNRSSVVSMYWSLSLINACAKHEYRQSPFLGMLTCTSGAACSATPSPLADGKWGLLFPPQIPSPALDPSGLV